MCSLIRLLLLYLFSRWQCFVHSTKKRHNKLINRIQICNFVIFRNGIISIGSDWSGYFVWTISTNVNYFCSNCSSLCVWQPLALESCFVWICLFRAFSIRLGIEFYSKVKWQWWYYWSLAPKCLPLHVWFCGKLQKYKYKYTHVKKTRNALRCCQSSHLVDGCWRRFQFSTMNSTLNSFSWFDIPLIKLMICIICGNWFEKPAIKYAWNERVTSTHLKLGERTM